MIFVMTYYDIRQNNTAARVHNFFNESEAKKYFNSWPLSTLALYKLDDNGKLEKINHNLKT